MQSGTIIAVSPSFTSLSSNNLADVAARVVQEFRNENGYDYDDIFNFNDYDYDNSEYSVPAEDETVTNIPPENLKEEKDCDTDDEFEFAVVCSEVNSSSISADESFSRDQILPRYPLFDRSLLSDVDPNLIKVDKGSAETACKPSLVVRLPLRELFSEEREFSSCSSSEADDLDGVTPGTYCVWKPKAETPGRCTKSNSTGTSSKRWKFRDIIYRSNSNLKETPFLIFKPLIATNKMINNEKVKNFEKSDKVAAAVRDGTSAAETEVTDPANISQSRGNRRWSFLPSGQTLTGVFTNVSRSN